MTRYITDEDTFRVLSEYYHQRTEIQRLALSEAISRVPTADAVEVRHGKWWALYDEDSPQDGVWKCSECGYIRLSDDCSPMNFCPDCGAKMDGNK